MLSFIAGMVTGVFVGVVCMAIFTAASEADRDAEKLFRNRHTAADK